MDKIGSGGSSSVHKAMDTESHQLVAIKRVDLTQTSGSEAEGFRNEINLLHKLRGNRRIITIYDCEDRTERYV